MKTNVEMPKRIVERLQQYDYEPEELQLLFLAPFVQVAWAEGFVQPIERRAILKLAVRFGITPQHPQHQELIEWLNERPTDEFFRETTKILGEMLEILPPFERRSLRRSLEAGSLRVAQAAPDTGVFPHRSRITPEEHGELHRLGKLLSFSFNNRFN